MFSFTVSFVTMPVCSAMQGQLSGAHLIDHCCLSNPFLPHQPKARLIFYSGEYCIRLDCFFFDSASFGNSNI